MKEFGSDFHFFTNFLSNRQPLTYSCHNMFCMADGRLCISALLQHYNWKRIWMPEYFCYNIIECLRKDTGTEIVFYVDYPGNDDKASVSNLPFQEGDVLFRMNYFGLRSFRSEKEIPVPVIEDHSHDLVGDWAQNSDADWCIASLRKIIPIPEGGIMWSPKGIRLSQNYKQTAANVRLSQSRWKAMEEKSKYLRNETSEKDVFRQLFLETEDAFDTLDVSCIDDRSKVYLECFDINSWNSAKKTNWEILRKLFVRYGVKVVCPERDDLVPFSLITLFETKEKRDDFRRRLIAESIYPAILWNVPTTAHASVMDFSNRMLSIHCDGRYDESDLEIMCDKIRKILKYD